MDKTQSHIVLVTQLSLLSVEYAGTTLKPRFVRTLRDLVYAIYGHQRQHRQKPF